MCTFFGTFFGPLFGHFLASFWTTFWPLLRTSFFRFLKDTRLLWISQTRFLVPLFRPLFGSLFDPKNVQKMCRKMYTFRVPSNCRIAKMDVLSRTCLRVVEVGSVGRENQTPDVLVLDPDRARIVDGNFGARCALTTHTRRGPIFR